jgi:hypothetical protein
MRGWWTIMVNEVVESGSDIPEVEAMVTPSLLKPLLVVLATLLLYACKLVVIVPEGGRVVTEDGFVCEAGEPCTIEVNTDTFDSTFTAEPAEGYTFTRWATIKDGFCGYTTAPCHLFTKGFAESPVLMNILAGDREFYLRPVFVKYNIEYWQNVLAEIEQGTFTTDTYLYGIKPSAGSCDPGSLKPAPKARVKQALEEVRALHDLPPVDYDGFYDMQMQETSLVQRANNYGNHFPAPEDACYTAMAAEGAQTSNLSSSSVPTDPARDIFGWTNDNLNAADLMLAGHRRWVLFPELGFTSYGQVEGYTSLKVFSFGSPSPYSVPQDLEFVALPYRYYPYILVSQPPNPTPWSISMVPQNGASGSFNYFASASVEVIEDSTGNKLPIQNLTKDNQGFGTANFLSWLVDGWEYDVEYTVRILDVRMPGGDVRDIEYPVVVDRYHLFNLDYPLEAGDRKSAGVLQGNFNNAQDTDSYKVPHTGMVSVSGTSEFSNMGFFIRIYSVDKKLLASSDSPFELKFPPGQVTVLVSPCDENGLCYQTTQTYRVTFSPKAK